MLIYRFITSWPQWGGPAGLFLANLAVLAFSAISGDQFLTWGWRVPFWLSIVMVGIGLYIRLGILETPVFRRIPSVTVPGNGPGWMRSICAGKSCFPFAARA